MPDAKRLYEEDFAAWSKNQADALRAAARSGSNLRLDWENLAEEIEVWGNRRRGACAQISFESSNIFVKLEHSPAIDPRNCWRRSIRVARLQIGSILEDNPSLRGEVGRLVGAATRDGIELAILWLEEHGEIDATDYARLRRSSYTPDQVLGDWFPPEPPREER